MRIVRSSVLALMLSAASAAMLAGTAQAQVSVDIRVNLAPPPLPFYEQPVIPAEGYIWVPGFWAWDEMEADYYWVPGTWVEPPQPELLWTPAYWGWDDGRYFFHPGYWGREVGFTAELTTVSVTPVKAIGAAAGITATSFTTARSTTLKTCTLPTSIIRRWW